MVGTDGEERAARALITIEGVSKMYATGTDTELLALDDVSLTVGDGEFVSVLGPSGCGKTTLLMIIAGLYQASTGDVRISGRAVTAPQTDIGIVFQSPVLLDWRNVIDNVLLQVEARGIDRNEYRQRATDLLASVGLAGFERSYPYALSGGMRQRASLVRALIHDPPLLLMDEPFGALDALTREQMMIDLQRMWTATRKTIVFVTHSIREAVFQSDRVIVMSPRPGRVERIWKIDLPRPRRLKMTSGSDFARYTQQITDLFMSKGVIREDEMGA